MSKNTDKTDLGDRMKAYERVETDSKFSNSDFLIARLDGRSFSKLTKNLIKPFDSEFKDIMERVAVVLLEETNAKLAYQQSDEITLVLYNKEPDSQFIFDGKKHKMLSIFSAIASVEFSKLYDDMFGGRGGTPSFDCRIFSVPTLREASNNVLWRTLDAERNAILGIAQSIFSHKELQHKKIPDILDMLKNIDVDIERDYEDRDLYGSFFTKTLKEHTNGDEKYYRHEIIRPIKTSYRKMENRLSIFP